MIITTHIIIYMGYNITKQQQIDIYVANYMKALHQVRKNIMDKHRPPRIDDDKNRFFPPPPPPRDMPPLDLKIVNKELNKFDLEISTINYKKLIEISRLLSYEKEWELYKYNGFMYFYFKDGFPKILIKDNTKNVGKIKYMVLLTILLNIVFISFYIYLIRKLKPLNILKKNIVLFSKGSLDIDTSCNGKDEISEVSNEFNNAIQEIRMLTQSRNLFLRNIMHELKTPITKGLLISNMMEDGKFKDSLKRAFFRLEYLLVEFSRIEEFTSKNIKIQKDQFRVVDIIDHSLDILLCDIECIDLQVIDNIMIDVDFELFSLTIKNLLDNAIKYGEGKPKVIIKNNTIYIQNIGKQLTKPINEYNKPFNKKFESSNNGLGLGLYIVNSILKAHELKLEYKFEDNKNIFFIKF